MHRLGCHVGIRYVIDTLELDTITASIVAPLRNTTCTASSTNIWLTPLVNIEASKDGVKFSCNGDIGNGSVTLRSHTPVDKPEMNVDIELTEPVSLTFSLKYLVNFCKAAALSTQVKICLSSEVPLLVEYNLSGSSYLRFYLAPKVRFPWASYGDILLRFSD